MEQISLKGVTSVKKTVSLLLALLLVLSSALPAFAEDPAGAAAGCEYPLIIARGMDFDGVYTNYGTPEQTPCFRGVTAGGVIRTLFRAVKNAFTMGFSHGLAVAGVEYVQEILGDMACDETGASVKDVGCDRYPASMAEYPEFLASAEADESKEPALARTASEVLGAENVYYYSYDYRLDPYELADELNALIELARSEHGGKKAVLVNCSMAGVITDCYLNKYGSEALAKIVFLSSTFCGTDVTDEVLRGKVETSENMLAYFIETRLGLPFLAKLARRSGLLRAAADWFNGFAEREYGYVFDAFLRPTFGTMLSVWANVQPENVDAALEYAFSTPELKEQYAPLIEKIRRLQTVMEGRDAMLRALPENGVAVAVVAGYDTSAVPLYASAARQADGILDSRWMFGGAETSEMGGSLGVTGAYVSPDGCVDLTDVLFPDYTWAIRDCGHVCVKYGSDCSDLIMRLICFDGQPTVNDFEEYPQFFTVDRETENRISEKKPPC